MKSASFLLKDHYPKLLARENIYIYIYMLECVELILNSYLLVIIFDLILQCHSADVIVVVVVVFIVVPLFIFFFGLKELLFG